MIAERCVSAFSESVAGTEEDLYGEAFETCRIERNETADEIRPDAGLRRRGQQTDSVMNTVFV